MNSTTIRKEKIEINKFDIVEYAIGKTLNRHKFHSINDSIDVSKDSAVYRSYFLHTSDLKEYFNSHKKENGDNTLSGYSGCISADELKIDIDEKENSLDIVRKLLRSWQASYDLDLRHIRVNFSGSKGFHIRIPAVLFGGFEPSAVLPTIHKQLAIDLTGGITIDESVYRTTGLFREVNSINKKSGLFAIPLSIDEVFSLSYEEIQSLATSQRIIQYLDTEELMAVEDLVQLKERVVAECSSASPTIKLKPNKWESVGEGKRFDTLSSAIGRLIRSNLSNDDIMQLGLMINSQHNPPKEEKLARKQIQDLLNKYGNVEGNFWLVRRHINKKDLAKIEVKIDLSKYIEYLNREGFSKIYLEKLPLFIRSVNNLVREYSVPLIKDHVMTGITEPYRLDIQNTMLEGVGKYYNEKLLECVNTTELILQRDEKDKAYIYYKNGYVTLEKGKAAEITPLSELRSPIWESSIIEREIQLLRNKTRPAEFEIFLRRVMRNNEERFMSLCSAIGYLLHDFKDQSNAKAIVLCDERISDVPNGRSGKSLLGKAIRQIKSVANIDGKNFEFGSRFTFQSVDLDTKVVDFNDVKKDFDFEKLFSVLTDDMTLEYKNEKPVRIPFADSPKIMVSTNYTIKGNGGSFKDRMFEIEFSDHYTEYHKPIDEFGHLFFQDWDTEEWNRFDNFMLECLQLYLDEGIIGCAPLNLAVRKLRDQTSPEFVEFAEENIIIREEYNLKDLYERFKKSIGYDFEFSNPCPIKQNTFTDWLKTYSDFKGLSFHKRPSNGRQLITLKDRQ